MKLRGWIAAALAAAFIISALLWGAHWSQRRVAQGGRPPEKTARTASSPSAKSRTTPPPASSTPALAAAIVSNKLPSGAPTTDDMTAKLFADSRTVRQRQTEPDANGVFMREKLVQTHFKYPLLRVQEKLQSDGATGRETIIHRDIAVGDHVLVRLNEGTSVEELQALAADHGGAVTKQLYGPRYYLVSFPNPTLDTVPEAVKALASAKAVVHLVQPDNLVHIDLTPNDPSFTNLYGLNNTGQTIGGQVGVADADIDAPEAWNTITGSANIIVGVIDTGINYNHPDLKANVWTNPGEIPGNGIDDDGNGVVDDVHGVDFFHDDSDPMDDNGHGSHCSGTIGAVGNNGVGVTGVCWTVRLAAIKFIGPDGFGDDSDAVSGIYYGIRMGFNLTSNSWGSDTSDPALAEAITDAGTANQLFIAAAGNDAANSDSVPHYPAAYPNDNIISVAATDNKDHLATFSNYGLTTVDLGAPGVNVYSTVLGSAYAYFNGTSMATPHVAGAAALALSRDPQATYATIKNRILSTVDPNPALTGKSVTGGRLNLNNLIASLALEVYSVTPAKGQVLSTQPTTFIVQFTDPYNQASVQATDFTVNGIAATSVAYTNSTTATFSFTTSPVSTQGPQTMAIAAGAITRLSDGGNIDAWTAQFFYDLTPMTVLSTTPANGSTAFLPLTSITVRFNEAFDPSTIDARDLVISTGTVTGVQVTAPDTAVFAISGLTSEVTLTFSVPARTISDVYGNPNTGWTGTLLTDYGVAPFPTAFNPLPPLGSLAGEALASAGIHPVADTDSFTFVLQAGQSLSAAVEPVTIGLRPHVEIRNPVGTLISSADAASAGQSVMTTAGSVPAAGTYTVTVAGVSSTTGDYRLRMFLNAALEAERYNGPSNNTSATAQNIDASFVSLGGNATRAVLVGSASSTDTSDWYSFTAAGNDRVTLIVTGYNGGGVMSVELDDAAGTLITSGGAICDNADSVVDGYTLSTAGAYRIRVSGAAASYTLLALKNAAFDLEGNDSSATAQDLGTRTVIAGAIAAPAGLYTCSWEEHVNESVSHIIHKIDPMTGNVRQAITAPPSFIAWAPYVLSLAFDGTNLWYEDGYDAALYKVDSATGSVLGTFSATASSDLAYYQGEIFLADTFDVAMEVHSAATGAVTRTLNYSAGAGELAGVAGDNAHGCLYAASSGSRAIYQFNPVTGDTMDTFDLATSQAGATLSGMAVLGDEMFVGETDSTNYTSTLNRIDVYDRATGTLLRQMPVTMGRPLGGLAGDGIGTSEDWYQFPLNNGDRVTFYTDAPSGSAFAYNQPLDPALDLYAPGGALVLSDDNGRDGLNARMIYTATASGTYRIRVRGVSGRGAYLLQIAPSTAHEKWLADHFTPAELGDPLLTGDAADFDKDGISNLLEWALNLDPKTADVTHLPALGQIQVGNEKYLTLQFTRRLAPSGLIYTPQACGDLSSWSGAACVELSATDDGNGLTETVLVRDTFPLSTNPKRFMHLQVSVGP